MPNLKLLASIVAEIWIGSQTSKSRSRDPFTTLFDLILHFSLGPPVTNLYAKFEVSIFNRCRDMEGIPKFQKVGHNTFTTSFDLMLHFFV